MKKKNPTGKGLGHAEDGNRLGSKNARLKGRERSKKSRGIEKIEEQGNDEGKIAVGGGKHHHRKHEHMGPKETTGSTKTKNAQKPNTQEKR